MGMIGVVMANSCIFELLPSPLEANLMEMDRAGLALPRTGTRRARGRSHTAHHSAGTKKAQDLRLRACNFQEANPGTGFCQCLFRVGRLINQCQAPFLALEGQKTARY